MQTDMQTPPSPSDIWAIYCDGTALPNPGRMAIGAVLIAPDGTRHALSQSTGMQGCNNEAEVRALIAALHMLSTLTENARLTGLRIYSDSSILIEQLSADPPAPIVRLAYMFDEARASLAQFEQIALQWIPRHRNTEADALARAALGLQSKASLKPRPKKRYAR